MGYTMGNNHSGTKFAEHMIAMAENESYAQNRKEQRKKMKEVFDDIDKTNTGTIEKKEIETLFNIAVEGYHKAAAEILCDEMPNHKNITKEEIGKLFEQADAENNKRLPFHEFMALVDKLCELLL